MTSDGRIMVPAVAAGQSVRFLLDTRLRLDLRINIGYAAQQGWAYERRNASWGMSPLADVFALGYARPHSEVVVGGTEEESKTVYYTSGTLGVQYVNKGVLALDPVDVAVGLSQRSEMVTTLPAGSHRVALVEATLDRLPVTLDLTDEDAPGHHPRFLIDTARPSSVVSLRYTEHAWRSAWRRRSARRAEARNGKTDVHLCLPSAESVDVEMFVVAEIDPGYVADLGTHLDGYLGLDFLYRWLPIFDFPRSALWLVPLGDSTSA